MKSIKNIVAIALVGLLVGCANPYAAMRDANRSALNRVELGMSKSQVIAVMGEKAASGMNGTVENPYRREMMKGLDGGTYEILYYYTEQIGEKPVETGLTPIVLNNGKVTGIGWGYLDSLSGNSTTTIRRR